MSLSERIVRGRVAARLRGDPRAGARHRTVPWTAVSEFKVSISNALFERLGQRLFETQNEEQLRAAVVSEIPRICQREDRLRSLEERPRPARPGDRS